MRVRVPRKVMLVQWIHFISIDPLYTKEEIKTRRYVKVNAKVLLINKAIKVSIGFSFPTVLQLTNERSVSIVKRRGDVFIGKFLTDSDTNKSNKT